MHDPIADMLTRIRNGQQAKHQIVKMNSSLIKEQIAKVLKEEGYITDYEVTVNEKNFKQLTVRLKYYQGRPVIKSLKRISKPGLRTYKQLKELKSVPGFGIAILSTSKGVMTHHTAKKSGTGGEILCEVA